jgi:hypothetical protein
MSKHISESEGIGLEAMDPNLRYRWAMALKSGTYKQARGTLRRVQDNVVLGHCCLGVLCDLTDLGTWHTSNNVGYEVISYWWGNVDKINPLLGDLDCYTESSYDGEDTLPDALRDALGIQEDDANRLMSLNDGDDYDNYPKSFDYIADVILDTLVTQGHDLEQLEANRTTYHNNI